MEDTLIHVDRAPGVRLITDPPQDTPEALYVRAGRAIRRLRDAERDLYERLLNELDSEDCEEYEKSRRTCD